MDRPHLDVEQYKLFLVFLQQEKFKKLTKSVFLVWNERWALCKLRFLYNFNHQSMLGELSSIALPHFHWVFQPWSSHWLGHADWCTSTNHLTNYSVLVEGVWTMETFESKSIFPSSCKKFLHSMHSNIVEQFIDITVMYYNYIYPFLPPTSLYKFLISLQYNPTPVSHSDRRRLSKS